MTQIETRETFKVKDISLADWGRREIMLAENEMPGLMAIRKKIRSDPTAEGCTGCRLLAHDDSDGRLD